MNSNETELDRLIIEATGLVMFGDLTDTPEPDTWGICFCSRSISGDEFENGGFFWFESKSDLFDYVGRLLVFANYQKLSPNPFELAGEAADIVQQVSNNILTMDEGLFRLNQALLHNSEIQWWGQFTDLLNGSRPFETKIRADHHVGCGNGSGDESAIILYEIDKFRLFLQRYLP